MEDDPTVKAAIYNPFTEYFFCGTCAGGRRITVRIVETFLTGSPGHFSKSPQDALLTHLSLNTIVLSGFRSCFVSGSHGDTSLPFDVQSSYPIADIVVKSQNCGTPKSSRAR
jgi:hypothetical protein